MSRRQLAQLLYVKAASVERWETGKSKPNTSSVNTLTKWLERTDFKGSNKEASRSEFGEAIASKRSDRGLSQEQVAQYLGVSETTLASWESNAAFPNRHNLKKVMQLLAADSFERVAEHPKFTTLGQDIKNRRKKLGLTQPELAERLDVAVGTIGRWESEAKPSSARIEGVSEWLAEEVPESLDRILERARISKEIREHRQALEYV